MFCPISILLHTKFNFVLCIIKTEDDRRTVETCLEKVSFIFLNFFNLRSHCLLWSFHLISGFDYFGLVLPKVFWSKADVNPDCFGYTIEECSKHTWQRRLISYESWVKQKNHNNYAAYKAVSFLNEWKFIFCCLFISTEWISGMFLLINYFNIAGMLLSVGMGKSKKTDKSLSQIKNYQKSLVTIVLN